MSQEITKLRIKPENYSLVLPQSYDETLTFYEYINKLYYAFTHISDYTFNLEMSYDPSNYRLTLGNATNSEGE